MMRRLPQLTALLVGVLTLVVFELGLRILGVGDRRDRPDSFATYSGLLPTFELGADGRYRAREHGTLATRSFLAHKAENGFRIFVFGGSSEAGTPYGYDWAFPRFLQDLLIEALPSRSVEVVNMAAPGFGSRRILHGVREAEGHAPDLFVLSLGHNEVVEQRLYAHLYDYPAWLFGTQQHLRTLHAYILLEDLVNLLRGGKSEGRAVPFFGPMASNHWQDEPRDAERQRYLALSMFRKNLEQMIQAARRVGARLLIMSQSKNYADWPVTASVHREGLDDEELAQWQTLMERAAERRAAGDTMAAIAALEEARVVDPRWAATHQQLGDLRRAAGDGEAARIAYREAHNTTLANFGTTPLRNEILRELARSRDTLWIDMDREFEAASPDGLVGFNLFVDFLHPNLAGHQLMARAVFAELKQRGVAVAEEQWASTSTLETPEQLTARLPQLRARELRIRIVAEMLSERPDAARQFLEELSRVAPDDPQLPRIEKWLAGDLPFDFKLVY